MSESEKKSKSGMLAVLVVLIGLAVLATMYKSQSPSPSTIPAVEEMTADTTDLEETTVEEAAKEDINAEQKMEYTEVQAEAISEDEAEAGAVTEDTTTPEEAETAQAQSAAEMAAVEAVAPAVDATATTSAPDLASLGTPRILGNPSAPIKISEHSSFTCGACSAYHRTNFKEIKKDYVDTGKAYVVFDDFPRNAVDIEIGALARCIEDDAYFNFVQLMFETQDQWARGDYKQYAIQNAVVAGLPKERAEECMNSEVLKKALADNRETAQTKHNVSATPTLVINDTTVIPGLTEYSELKKVIEGQPAQ